MPNDGGTARNLPIGPPPRAVLLLVALAAMILLSVALATDRPWLGISGSMVAGEGFVVTHALPGSPAAAAGLAGVTLIAVETEAGSIPLADYPLNEGGANVLPSYARYNAYLNTTSAIRHELVSGEVTLQLADGRRVTLAPGARTPLLALGHDFWVLHLSGLAALFICIYVLVFRPDAIEARLLALSGIGFFTGTWFNSLWITQELAAPSAWFHIHLILNEFSLHVLSGALLALLCLYPIRLARPAAVLCGVSLFTLAAQTNEILRLFEWPLHAYYAPVLLYYVAALVAAALQWRATRRRPLERAALRWIMLSVLATTGVCIGVFYGPIALGYEPVAGLAVMVPLALSLYFFLAVGVYRQRLFSLEIWWFRAFVWSCGGLVVLVLDAALILLLKTDALVSTGLAVLLVGWIYLPIRHWLWSLFVGSKPDHLDRHMTTFVKDLLASGRTSDGAWWDLCQNVFSPLERREDINGGALARIVDDGLGLYIPDLSGGTGMRLSYADGARRLFQDADIELVSSFRQLGLAIVEAQKMQDARLQQERSRIARDLHDDVGRHLLSILYGAAEPPQAERARRAIAALRESINALNSGRTYWLADLVDEMRAEMEERLPRDAGEPRMAIAIDDTSIPINTRTYVNLRRAFDEALTNAIKHGERGSIGGSIRAGDGQLHIRLNNDVAAETQDAPAHCDGGNGLVNIATRMAELGGDVTSDVNDGRFSLEISAPLRT